MTNEEKAVGIGLDVRDNLVLKGVKRNVAELFSIFAQESAMKMAEWKDEQFRWHDVAESLPENDEEVIVLLSKVNGHNVGPFYRIAFGHIVDKEIAEDYDGWNIPGVKYWMPMPILRGMAFGEIVTSK